MTPTPYKTIEECKDEVADLHAYNDWRDLTYALPENNFLYQVDLLKPFSQMEDLLNDMLQNETHFSNE